MIFYDARLDKLIEITQTRTLDDAYFVLLQDKLGSSFAVSPREIRPKNRGHYVYLGELE